MKVKNMTGRTGREVANQFIITDDEGRTFFQSYNSIIAKVDGMEITLDEKCWDYSITTGKYRNEFLFESKAETQKKIDTGVYKLANLNS